MLMINQTRMNDLKDRYLLQYHSFQDQTSSLKYVPISFLHLDKNEGYSILILNLYFGVRYILTVSSLNGNKLHLVSNVSNIDNYVLPDVVSGNEHPDFPESNSLNTSVKIS